MDRAWVRGKGQPWPITHWLGDHGQPSSSLLSLCSLGWTFFVSISLCFFSSLCISRSPLPPLPSGGAFGVSGGQLWPQHVSCGTSQVVAVLVLTLQMKTPRSCLQGVRHGQVPGSTRCIPVPLLDPHSPLPPGSRVTRLPLASMECSVLSVATPLPGPRLCPRKPPVLTPFPPSHWQDCIFQRDRNREWPSLQLWEIRKLA